MESFENLDGSTWVMFSLPMLALLVLIAIGVGVILGALISRVTDRQAPPPPPWWPGHGGPPPPPPWR